MSYFKYLLQKRGLEECPLPLWKLKLTELEFKELRDLLEERTYRIDCENPFDSVRRESALFFAEYWRRLYVEGKHSKQMVYDALESKNKINFCDEFYDAAIRGAEFLKIEKYEGGKADPLNDMLYQGGLPMKLVTADITNSIWDRFTRGLVNRKINFDELSLGLIASQSQSMKDYCERLILGIEAEQYMLMPFFCQDENDVWFRYLLKLAHEERCRKQQHNPFLLDWEFEIDFVEKLIHAKYIVKGWQRLPQSFLEKQGLNTTNFFSVQVRKNGKSVDTFDYSNNFCRYSVVSKHIYEIGDYISLFLHNQEDAFISDSLDMSVPHLLYIDNDGKYKLGNRIGRQESILLIPEGWHIDSATTLKSSALVWNEDYFRSLSIPADYTDAIKVVGNDGFITFGIDTPLYWTEMQTHPLYAPDIIEPIYNADKCVFRLCYDTEDGVISRCRTTVFRNKWNNVWTDKPAYGEIFARALDANGNYVTPIRFINVGDNLKIGLIKSDKDSCQIKVTWPYGHVSTNEGELKSNDVWEIRKNNCGDPRKIHFVFTPANNCNNQFTLSIKVPFKDFSIVDIYGDNINDDVWIPFTDIDKYQYHLVGQNVKEYFYGNIRRSIRWKDDKLVIQENGVDIKTIPYEGTLLTLFDSREALRSLLERTSKNMLKAEINVRFLLYDGTTITFSIKDSPLRPHQTDDGHIVITGNNKIPVKFTGVLKLLKLDEPDCEPVEMSFDEENGNYTLPETIRSWGNAILIGRTRGRICPALVNLSCAMNGEERFTNRAIAIEKIKDGLQHSHIGDELWTRALGWFNRTHKNDIPASSILELYCTAQDYKSLFCLAFQLYIKCSNVDEEDTLKEQLKSFSIDLAFQWYWLHPYISDLFVVFSSFLTGNEKVLPIKEMYIKWAMSHNREESVKLLSALNDDNLYTANIGRCFLDVLNSFTLWMKDLFVSSLVESYESDSSGIFGDLAKTIILEPDKICKIDSNGEGYIESSQDYLGDEVGSFFNGYCEPGKLGNENWFHQRVNVVAAHLRKNIDLFSMDEEIRRSIIYCCKSSNTHFIISLNNKLSH